MQIKRVWRFIKWSLKGFGWFEWSWFFGMMCIGFAVATDNPEHRTFAYIIFTAIFAFWAVKFAVLDVGRMAWNRFKEDDERAFNILKDKNIK